MIRQRRTNWVLALVIVVGASGFGALGSGPASATENTIEIPAGRLTVVMTEVQPFVERDGDRADGFYAEIWDEVANELGVDYEVIWVDSFAELLPTVEAGTADVAVAPLTPTAEREVAFDFSSAVVGSGPQLANHERIQPRTSLISALFSSSIRWVMAACFGGLLILSHLIWLVERNRTDPEGTDFASSYLRGIWDGFWWAAVTVTTVGYGDKAPRSHGGRAIALLAMFLSLFVMGAFVSLVNQDLQARRSAGVVSTIDEIKGRPVASVVGSSFSNFLIEQEVELALYESQSKAFEAVDSGEVDIIVTNQFALESLGPRYGIVPSDQVLYKEFESFGLAQGSAWREPINQAIADLQGSGEVEEIIERWLH